MASAYEQLIAELQQLQNAPAPQPMFTPEQQAARIRQNNDQVNLGLLGQMSNDPGVRGTGGHIFKTALGGREESVNTKGVFDPLTGNTAESPEYQQQRAEGRKAKILEQALRFEDQRQKAMERADQQRQRAADQIEMRRLVASGRAGTDAELMDLKKELIRSQIAGNTSRVDQAEAKVEDKQRRAQAGAASAAVKAENVIKRVDEATKLVGNFTAGAPGKIFSKIPGSTAYDLKSTIATIKANIGFEELSAMRQASPTGGALGQVAVQELNYLQAVLGNLDEGQSPTVLKKNLGDVRKHFENWKNVMQQAASRQGGATDSWGGSDVRPGRSPGPGAAPHGVDPTAWQYMTPEERQLWK